MLLIAQLEAADKEIDLGWLEEKQNHLKNKSTTTLNIMPESVNLTTTDSSTPPVNPYSIHNAIDEKEDLNVEPSTSFNETVKEIPINQEQDKEVGIVNSGTTSNLASFFTKNFDGYTLIFFVAFVVGFVLLVSSVIISICVCKSCNALTGVDKGASDLATNPAYDHVKYKPGYESDPDSDHLNEIIIQGRSEDAHSHETNALDIEQQCLINKPVTLLPKSNQQDESLLNATSSLSCSSASVNSVVFKTPSTIQIIKSDITKADKDPSTTVTPMLPQKASNLNLNMSSIRSKLSSTPTRRVESGADEPDTQSVRKFLPAFKSNQQLLREQKITDKSVLHASYSRTQSECISGETATNRLSMASSRSSILMPAMTLDFGQIRDDIEDLALHKEKLVSRTNLATRSHTNSQTIDTDEHSDSVNNSIADIYMKEFINNKLLNKQNKMNISLSNTSSTSEIKADKNNNNNMSKRFSMNIDASKINFEPSGAVSRTNLNKNESASTYTMESEKSCY